MVVVAILVTSSVIFRPKIVILKSFSLLLGCTVHVGQWFRAHSYSYTAIITVY